MSEVQIELIPSGTTPNHTPMAPAEVPRAGPDLRKGLRYYQHASVDSAKSLLIDEDLRAVLIVAATGTGKTQTFCTLASEWRHGRVLILSHRTELVMQAVERLESMSGGLYRLGRDIGIEQGQTTSRPYNRFISASVASLKNKDRLNRFAAQGGCGLIIIDEGHHATAKSYLRILDAFPAAKVVGVTATPKRSDNKAMGMVFDQTAYVYGIEAAVPDGFLVPIHGEEVMIEEINLDNVSKDSAGDLAAGQLDAEMAKAMDGMIRELVLRVPTGTEQGIIFCPGVLTAHYAAERLNREQPGCAAVVDGKTDPLEREAIIRRFKAGEIQWLSNCMVATEGFDAPATSVVAMMRPTSSSTVYVQCVGRGLRPLDGLLAGLTEADQAAERLERISTSTKPRMRLIDFVGNNTKHELVTPVDILGGDYTEDEKKLARKKQKTEGGDPLVNLAWAREALKRAAKSRSAVQVRSQSKRFDPLAVVGVSKKRDQDFNINVRKEKALSPKMEKALRAMGFSSEDLAGLSMHGGRQLFKKIKARNEKGLANMHQLKVLAKHGVFSKDITYSDAGAAMTYINQCLTKRTSPNPSELIRITKGKKL